jgi:hypothetical protein
VSKHKSGDEVRADYIVAMGEDLGSLFYAASHELTWTHWRWNQYRALFAEKPSRIELLNEAAALFFRIVQDVLFDDTVLSISKLLASPESRGKPNLTVRRIPSLLPDPILRDHISMLIEEAKTSAEFAFDRRNRQIAHIDLDLALYRSAQPLAIATREKVETSLSVLRNILNDVELKYCNAHTMYTSSSTPGDAVSLMYTIREGLLRERSKRARWERGEFRPEDAEQREEI